MTLDLTTLDAHAQPDDELKATWKRYSKTDHADFINHPDIDELDPTKDVGEFQLAGHIPREKLISSFKQLEDANWDETRISQDAPFYFHPLLPGLLIFPSLIPPSTQKALLSRMIHRDLSNPTHQTNLHLHYDLPYREEEYKENDTSRSFFSYSPESPAKFVPKDPNVHKPLSIKQVLERRLSWVTLGGQYDWTNRVYPNQPPPGFPPDIATLLQTLFPDTLAQAAIVNFYTPGDTMMMHRDVSEESDKGLVSLSIGCDALFMIAPNNYKNHASSDKEEGGKSEKPYLLLRLRSGDAIYMSQESRYAWHGVPKVLKGTCPDFLADWPAEDGKFEEWKGWMGNKRINLNVRQMKD
ncbi:alkylated DNA repair protein AlkB [Annulohypoxylon truncatum]|uniref:alkylated DNA repair protein AlkB n=1 Tax=Annulohypoxylon truncatum TaxID=327061 RepID=UPI0020087582|nr:alkylated DNA repair protein AlkB [Annulohypoxylon truncatum]KAI1205498.1 alkylated DNA repair protein AlkB [Annulohypoxylon truncatum]